MNRENHTSPEAVTKTMVVRLVADACFYKELFFVAFAQCFLRQGIEAIRTVAKLELFNDVITESTLAEISQTDAATVYMIL